MLFCKAVFKKVQMLSCSASEVWCCLEGGLVEFCNDRNISGVLFLALPKPYSYEERSFPLCTVFKFPSVLISMAPLVCLLKSVGSMAENCVVLLTGHALQSF